MGHPARHRLARAAAYAAVTVAFAAGIAGYQEHADRQLRRNQVEACERGNRLQASCYRGLLAPLPDCERVTR